MLIFFLFLKLIESYLGLFCFDFLNIKICSFLGFSLLAFMVSTLSSLLFFLFEKRKKKVPLVHLDMGLKSLV